MGISVLNGGLYTTVQDMGRTGYQNLGISSSGAMDQRSFHIANLLLDNPENEAVLEFIQTGPKLRFTADTIIAITGGNFEPSLNGKPVPMYTAVYVHKNDILKFHSAKTGSCGYLAFLGKLDIPMVMGSRSTHVSCKVGGFCGRRLQTGDFICFREKKVYLPHFLSRKLKVDDFDNQSETIRVILGPQDDCFTQEGRIYRYRLHGPHGLPAERSGDYPSGWSRYYIGRNCIRRHSGGRRWAADGHACRQADNRRLYQDCYCDLHRFAEIRSKKSRGPNSVPKN